MFENLSYKIDKAVKNLKGQGRITELNVATTVKQIRRALIDADVNYKVAKDVSDKNRKEAIGRDFLSALSHGHFISKIVKEELTQLMGGMHEPVRLKDDLSIILNSGLQGSGKTTFSGKLAYKIIGEGKKTLLVACDIYRPAAIEQLKVLGEQVGAEVYTETETRDPVQIAKNAILHARKHQFKVVIVDTAGRLAVDEPMMKEISALKEVLDPSETLFVVDAMTGQDAVNTAKTFNEKLNFDGVVLTKLDGDTRGGAALSIRAIVDKPIKFVSTGEKMDALDVFHPDRMAGRILGMGDVVSLVEKAQDAFDEDEARKLTKKIRKNQFNYEDFLLQLQQIKKMGSLKDLIGMIPGMGKTLKDMEVDDEAFKPIEAIIRSMTPYERANPDSLNGSRKKRIAIGSGTSIQQVNKLIKQFGEMRKMMKTMNQMGNTKRSLAGMNFMKN